MPVPRGSSPWTPGDLWGRRARDNPPFAVARVRHGASNEVENAPQRDCGIRPPLVHCVARRPSLHPPASTSHAESGSHPGARARSARVTNRGSARTRGALSLVPGDTDAPAPSCDALVALGQHAERQGQQAEARRCFEKALHVLTEDDARRSATILRWIARTHVTEGDKDAALDCLAASVAIADLWGDDAAAGSAINVEAVVRWQLGDLDEAERLYLTARARALKAGDAKLAAMTAQNLGVIANVRGDTDEARRHYEASLAEYRSL